MIALHRRSRLLVLLTLIGSAAVLSLALGAHPAQAASYKKCSLTQSERQPRGTMPKPTYNFKLEARSVGCATARKVMKSFHSCRSLKSYRCTRKVRTKWRCTGRKSSSAPGIFYANYTCTFGSRRVRGSYQQNVPTT